MEHYLCVWKSYWLNMHENFDEIKIWWAPVCPLYTIFQALNMYRIIHNLRPGFLLLTSDDKVTRVVSWYKSWKLELIEFLFK